MPPVRWMCRLHRKYAIARVLTLKMKANEIWDIAAQIYFLEKKFGEDQITSDGSALQSGAAW